jgi:hypothetical protein
MLLWRLTSIILKIEAPRPAAEVRNPERSEWPAKRFGSSPTRRALALTGVIGQALGANPPPFGDRPEQRPAGVFDASNHAFTRMCPDRAPVAPLRYGGISARPGPRA